MEKLNDNQYDLSGEFTFNEFLCFFWFVSDFNEAKNQIRVKSVDIKELVNIANKSMENFPDKSRKVKFTEKHMKLIFEILDTDKNGLLTIEEIDDILKRRDFFSTNSEYSDTSKKIYEMFKKGTDFLSSQFSIFSK